MSKNAVYQERERAKQEQLESIVNGPKPERGEDVVSEMPIDSAALDVPDMTTKNPAKIARKLRERRLAQLKGQHAKTGVKKKGNALAGANQFHKKTKKKKRR